MPRGPRIDLAGVPQHLIQRGNNREVCFYSNSDRLYYLECLRHAAKKYDASIHAYVLMSNHVHLLATGQKNGALGRMMQSIGTRFVRFINERHSRTGTLWEGRFRSSVVDSDHYLLTCYRYIELNPQRAGIVSSPSNYDWSSYRHNAGFAENNIVTPHPIYLALGKSSSVRWTMYRRLFVDVIDDGEIKLIREQVNKGGVLGPNSFIRHIEQRIDRKIGHRKPGRPRK